MYWLFIVLVSSVLSDACLTVNFEQGYSDDFSNEVAVCQAGMPAWVLGHYSERGLQSYHELSTAFITPHTQLSCVGSFFFQMTAGGIIEFNIFMNSTNIADLISMIVNQNEGNGEVTVGQGMLLSGSPGWTTVSITLGSSGTYMGYVSTHEKSMLNVKILQINK